YRLEGISGSNILQSAERNDADQRILEVTLKERTSGSYGLRLELAQTIKDLPKTMNILGVHPWGVGKLTGFVSVSVEPGVSIKPAGFEGLTEIPAGVLAGMDNSASSTVLAYKAIAGESQ